MKTITYQPRKVGKTETLEEMIARYLREGKNMIDVVGHNNEERFEQNYLVKFDVDTFRPEARYKKR